MVRIILQLFSISSNGVMRIMWHIVLGNCGLVTLRCEITQLFELFLLLIYFVGFREKNISKAIGYMGISEILL